MGRAVASSARGGRVRYAAKVDRPGKYLGNLCKRGHDHEGTGLSLRKESDRCCVVCCRERSLAAYHRDPSAFSATRDKDAQRKYQAAWRRALRVNDPEKCKTRDRATYQRNSLVIRLRNRLRKALVASIGGKTKPSHEYADFTAILNHLGPCPGPLSEWEIDHIRPLSLFDFSDPEQARAAFHPSNHQWLTANENRRKHAKECQGGR